MKIGLQENLGLIATLITLAAVPIGVFYYQDVLLERDGRLIELTGVNGDGVWTDEKVTAANAGLGGFKRATIIAAVGEKVTLRLSSADVTHSFYVPELNLGPIEVLPGHYVEVTLPTGKAGEFIYYCTSVCGACHHFMRGLIRIAEPGSALANKAIEPLLDELAASMECPDEEPPHEGIGLADRGAHLFRTKGCVSCHGEGGRGGVNNPNYIKGEVPALNELAEKMFLFDEEDADDVLAMLDEGEDLHAHAEDPPFRTYGRFLAQYDATSALIRNGNKAGKKDENGPMPPMSMPAWHAELSDRDVDAAIAYVISLYPWEEDD